MKLAKSIQPLLTTPKTHNILWGGRGGGKTRCVVSILTSLMIETPINILCCREVQKSLKESSYLAFMQEIQRQDISEHFTFKDGVIESVSGARAVFIGLQQHTVDSIKSYEGFHIAWIEEAQSISKKSLDTLIPTLRIDGHYKFLEYVLPLRMFIYTMNPYSITDAVYSVLPENREDVQYIEMQLDSNPFAPKVLFKERDNSKEAMAHDEFMRIWHGVPYTTTERSVFNTKEVQDAMERVVQASFETYTGADIARGGQDLSVFIKRKGNKVIDIKQVDSSSTQETARLLYDFAEKGHIVIDDTGVGGGVTDKLREMGAKVTAVNFGSRAIDSKRYKGVISEMWFSLKSKINEIEIPKHDRLFKELISRDFTYTADDKKQIESKEVYKKRTGNKSPDFADALILCFYTAGVRASTQIARGVI